MSALVQSRRTLTLTPEVATFAAMIVLPGTTDRAAHRTRFPRLTVEAPLNLAVDEDGWLRVTLVDPKTGRTEAGYVRADWAEHRMRQLGGWSEAAERIRSHWWRATGRDAELAQRWCRTAGRARRTA
jgi:hypothetical protein